MKEIIIAFDVDGTILNNENISPETPTYLRPKVGLNLEVIMLIQILSKKMKNTKIYVWSGGGKDYAESIVRMYGLERYVDNVFSKADYNETIHGKVDICFDDVHACALADKNLIVKMK
ncbi:MAG: hypothetical protein V4509_00600 [Patescibacteria group bacterium]